MAWMDFVYREFWDVPRAIILRFPGGVVLLDSLFLEDIDDYDDHYGVFRLPADIDLSGSWIGLSDRAIASLGRVAVKSITFDERLRRSLDLDAIRALLPDDLMAP